MERRKRRNFNAEFKAEAVRLVREGGKSVPQVAYRRDRGHVEGEGWSAGVEEDR